MNCPDVRDQMSDYIDSTLPAAEESRIAEHLGACEPCTAFLAELRAIVAEAAQLPSDIEPDEDLWSGIRKQITEEAARVQPSPHRLIRWQSAVAVAASVALITFAVYWFAQRGTTPAGWEVTSLAGTPVLADRDVEGTARLGTGEWLHTDTHSRARISVADIGRVDVGPGSAVQLLQSSGREHRIALARGEMQVFIWAPPRLFFVETPAGVAEDLGCEYTLAVDTSGNGELGVTLGFVSFTRDGHEVIIPGGSRCELRAGMGPGTPHNIDASIELRDALDRFDFEGGLHEALDEVLALSGEDSAVLLWHLIPRVDPHDRQEVFNRLAVQVPPPAGVTHEDVLHLDHDMLQEWWNQIHPGWSVW